jgi:hypothetical protein
MRKLKRKIKKPRVCFRVKIRGDVLRIVELTDDSYRPYFTKYEIQIKSAREGFTIWDEFETESGAAYALLIHLKYMYLQSQDFSRRR